VSTSKINPIVVGALFAVALFTVVIVGDLLRQDIRTEVLLPLGIYSLVLGSVAAWLWRTESAKAWMAKPFGAGVVFAMSFFIGGIAPDVVRGRLRVESCITSAIVGLVMGAVAGLIKRSQQPDLPKPQ
jgi:hypothetical protein